MVVNWLGICRGVYDLCGCDCSIQVYVGKRFAYLRSRIATLTDARVTLVSQAIAGVRVAKMNSYEEKFEREISAIRKQEVNVIQQVNRFRALNEAIFYAASVTTSVPGTHSLSKR